MTKAERRVFQNRRIRLKRERRRQYLAKPEVVDAICRKAGIRMAATVIEHAGMWAVAWPNGEIIKDGFRTSEAARRFIDRETER